MKRRKVTSDDIAGRLAKHADALQRRRADERQTEILEAFGITDEDDILPAWVCGLHRWHEDGDPQEPLPTGKATGKRYCRRCGCHKKLTSFDAVDGKLSDACRACEGGPKAVKVAA